MDAHAPELAHEQAGIELLGHLVLQPVGLGRELVVIPPLLGGEVVAFLHPLRLQPEEVHGHSHLAEIGGVGKDGPLVFTHVRAECKAIGPLGKHVCTSGNLGIEIQD